MRCKAFMFAILAGLTLTSCSAFVPSWNAQPTPIEIGNEADSSDVNEPEPQTGTEPEGPVDSTPEVETETETETEPQAPVERSSVTVEVVSAMAYKDEGQLEVIAQVFDVVEDGGECTMKLLAGDFSTEATVGANRSSSYTQCAPIDIPLSDLPGGTAVVTVSYLSERYEGESQAVSVVIP